MAYETDKAQPPVDVPFDMRGGLADKFPRPVTAAVEGWAQAIQAISLADGSLDL